MKKKLNCLLIIIILTVITAPTGFGQSLDKRINFSINAPFALRMGNYVLPSGNYVLRQVLTNDPNLFALYPEDLTNEPFAMIRTTRINFQASGYPEHTKIFIEMDETSPDNQPIIQGWTIPGMDGWEVISVVEKKSGVLTKYGGKEAYRKMDKAKVNLSKYDDKDKRSKILFTRKDK